MEENLSKALIMTAEVLLGILLLTIMIYVFSMGRDFSDTVDANIAQKVIAEFNTKFEYYNQRDDLTAQDVVTLANLVHDYNTNENTAYEIELQINGIESNYKSHLRNGPTKEQAIEFMQSYAPYIQGTNTVKRNFSCKVNYDENGRINKIQIQKNG